MKGSVLDFSIQNNEGLITGDDDKRYKFSGPEWRASEQPTRGMRVDFDAQDGVATVIFQELSKPAGMKGGVPTESNKALRMVIPIGRSGYAIAAGYLALFSVLFIPAPFALLFGILALRDIKTNPEKIGKGRAYFGVIMGGLFSVFLLFAIAGRLLK